ncbi:hypothetical protein HanHA300_Chr04g0133691 [Helianthus annuus]|nr:hypothetical protein HanHA300_Chr04g0133691 [Helianthus annuus]
MDTTDRRYLEEEDSSLTKTMKGAATGLAAGTIWGTVVATCWMYLVLREMLLCRGWLGR